MSRRAQIPRDIRAKTQANGEIMNSLTRSRVVTIRRLRRHTTALAAAAAAACASDQPAAPAGQEAIVRVITTVVVKPDTATIDVASALSLTATAYDAAGQPMSGQPILWSSSDETRATVSTAGVALGVGGGRVIITAGVGDKAGSSAITVRARTLEPPSPPLPPASPSIGPVISLAAGGYHTCALGSSGVAYCWGLNDYGQLGDGTTTSRPEPVEVRSDRKFVMLAAGDKHTCALTAEGIAYCWGANHGGAVGSETIAYCDPKNDPFGEYSTCSREPAAVDGGLVFMQISAAGERDFGFSCGLTPELRTHCWGVGVYGTLGSALIGGSPTPVQNLTDLKFRSLTAGGNHVCALTDSGVAYCWGGNSAAELGAGTTFLPAHPLCSLNGLASCAATPIRVEGGLSFRMLTAGANHTCGLVQEGRTYCWGRQAGGYIESRPTAVSTSLVFVSLSRGAQAGHTCGITADGAAACWGANDFGQLGDGSQTSTLAPGQAIHELNLTEVVTGRFHSCGLTVDKIAYCWGRNLDGQLGNGTHTQILSPVRISSRERTRNDSSWHRNTSIEGKIETANHLDDANAATSRTDSL